VLNFLRRTWSYIRLVAVTLAPSRFAILVLAIVTVALVRNGQGQEALRVVGEFGLVEQVGGREPYLVRLVSFLFADLVLALALWYFSRQILTIKNRQSRVAAVAEWGPRAMGCRCRRGRRNQSRLLDRDGPLQPSDAVPHLRGALLRDRERIGWIVGGRCLSEPCHWGGDEVFRGGGALSSDRRSWVPAAA
jgi:hypothetical protein